MKSHLHILHLEDDKNDADLIKTALKAGNLDCDVTNVSTEEEFLAALEKQDIDVILLDFTIPSFDGISAAETAQKKWPGIPSIVVSGQLSEELAVTALRSGATDYVGKNHLGRLVPAVKRALKEVEALGVRKRLEDQFIEAQKMEVIGHLAGGIAHDFNNMLAIIMSYSDYIRSELPPGSPLEKYNAEIRKASERAVSLTKQLLIFSRKEKVEPTVIDINGVLKNLEEMLRRLVDENIEITLLPGTSIGHVQADPGHLGQLLMNLVVNARDAMPVGGKLTIATKNVDVPQDASTLDDGPASGNYVVLSVSDTGTGMPEEIRKKIFEPFFTTKPKGKGTGLGLATCQTIAQQYGAHMTVASALGHGTTFNIYFKRVDKPISPVSEPPGLTSLPRGTETILVVEDEPTVRQLARNMLEKQGYKILTASNGQEALLVVDTHKGEPIAMVVTDVIMPTMGGKVMSEWLRTCYPEIKVLFTSGYLDNTIADQGVLDPGVVFLPKPYTPSTLALLVRKTLDEKVTAEKIGDLAPALQPQS